MKNEKHFEVAHHPINEKTWIRLSTKWDTCALQVILFLIYQLIKFIIPNLKL